MKQLCLGCMRAYDSEYEVCPYCGYLQNTPAKEVYHIAPGTTIHGRYLVGRVLGSGGFGITYIGYDMTLAKRVAIKEYLPIEFATRMPNQTNVTVYAGEKYEQFTAGMTKSLDEAKRLAEFRQAKGITQILDFFEENNTAYIVMELLEGETLKDRLKRQSKMPVEEALPIILSVIDALKLVHAKSIIHRDIAPDNIYLLGDGSVKLLDFGASRQVTTTHSKSLTVILKLGYAPIEQYQSGGNQGPWTDVYALAATFYRMITGKRPPESQERRLEDTLKEPSKLGVQIDKNMENALMNALNVKIEDRTQTAEEFGRQLVSSDVNRQEPTPNPPDPGKWPMWLKAVCVAGAAAVLVAFGVVVTGVLIPQLGNMREGPTLADNAVYAPNLVNLSQNDARDLVESRELVFEVGKTQTSDTILKGYVLGQTNEKDERIAPGDELEKGSVIRVVISSGTGKVAVPNLLWMQEDTARAELEKLGLIAINTVEDTVTWAPEGVVTGVEADGSELAVNGQSDVEVDENAVVTLKVSTGSSAGSGAVQIPDLTGVPEDDAYSRLKDVGLFLEKIEVKYDPAYDRGQIMSQQPAGGTQANQGDSVKVAVSSGARMVQLADLAGMPQAEATSHIEGIGLVLGEVTQAYDANIEAGRVISQSVASGTVKEGTAVDLVISLGPQPQQTTAPVTTSRPNPNPNPNPPQQTTTAAPPPETTTAAPPPPETTTAAPDNGNPFWDWRG